MHQHLHFAHIPDDGAAKAQAGQGYVRKLAYYACQEHERAALPALLCVHGLTRNGRDFDKLAENLCDRFCVLSPDMAGRGKSDWLQDPARYNYTTYYKDIDSVFQQLQLKSVNWLGTSMGGILGMMMAAQQPDRIKRLVLNDIGAFIPKLGLQRISQYIGKDMIFHNHADAQRQLEARYVDFGIDDEDDWQRLIHASLEQLPDGRLRLAYDPAIADVFSNPDAVQDVDMWPLWERIKCPVLILRGAHSDILTHETAVHMQATKQALVTYIEIPGAGHAPSLMREKEITLIRRFLTESD